MFIVIIVIIIIIIMLLCYCIYIMITELKYKLLLLLLILAQTDSKAAGHLLCIRSVWLVYFSCLMIVGYVSLLLC